MVVSTAKQANISVKESKTGRLITMPVIKYIILTFNVTVGIQETWNTTDKLMHLNLFICK